MILDEPKEEQVTRILFVCTGNTCRSPMAEALFRSAAAEFLKCSVWQLREHGVDVFSAGVAAWENSPASPQSVEVMKDRGLDLTQHLSRQVTAQMIAQSDAVLAMTPRHQAVLQQLSPADSERIWLLGGSGVDIADPFGGSVEEYRQCAGEIAEYTGRWVRRLLSKKVDEL